MVVEGASDERYATQRGSQLARLLDVERKPAEAIAWSELGYSRSGMAKEMDTTAGTIGTYHERAMAMYGFEILETHVTDHSDLPEYERVDASYVHNEHRTRTEIADWVDMVLNNERRLEAELVSDVREKAMERDISLTEL